MESKILYAIIASVAITMAGIALRMFAGQSVLQILLLYASFFVFGLIMSSVKKALILGLVLAVAYQFMVIAIFIPTEAFTARLSMFLTGMIKPIAISLALSLAGAFIGSKVLSRFLSSR